MMFSFVFIVLAALFTLPLALAYALPAEFPTQGAQALPYPLGQMSYTGTLGGHEIQMNGSVQQIHAQMTAMYPGFNLHDTVTADAGELVTRDYADKSDMECIPMKYFPQWKMCLKYRIRDGIDYLVNFPGLCGVPAQTCVRISCSYSAAIFLCNDKPYGITPSCKYISSYAGDIGEKCWKSIAPGFNIIGGQFFDTDGYNVIVREDRSC